MLTSCEYIYHKEWLCKDAIGEFTVKGYTDKHSLNFTQKFNIAEIKLRDQNVNRFPRGFGSFFPRLKRLNIIHCGLSTISRDDLIGLEELEHLAIIFNPLTSLPSDLFIGMTQLKSISFRDNKVKTMSSKLLDQILKNGPTKIDFRGNFKIDAFYSAEIIYYSVSLEKLVDLIDTNCDKPADEQAQISTVKPFKDEFTARFANLWESGEYSDLTIIGNDQKKFRVHKNVLAIQSPVFAEMFKHNTRGKSIKKVRMFDFSAKAVEQFLGCLYTGEINDVNAMEIYAMAAKYDVPRLKAASEEIILTNIEKLNAYDVFVLGHRYSSVVMQHKSFDAIKQTFKDIELDDGLMDDPKQLKVLIDANKSRKRKIKEVEREFASVCKLNKSKHDKTL